MDKRVYYIWLNMVLGTGSMSVHRMIENFGTAENAYNASIDEYKSIEGIKLEEANLLNKKKNLDQVINIFNFCEKNDIGIVCMEDNNFPYRLLNIVPKCTLLYYKGDINVLNEERVFSIVGTRNCHEDIAELTYDIAYELSEYGFVIVSGMALGIDKSAHEGAIDQGGKTVAFLANGVDRVYPYENIKIYNKADCVLSEFAPNEPPHKYNFAIRNRLLSGASDGVLIAQSPKISGAVNTANHAFEQGKDIFAIPASPTDPKANGVIKILADGAVMVECASDILDYYSIERKQKIKTRAEHMELTPTEEKIINLLKKQNCDLETICLMTGLMVSEASMVLMSMEMNNIIKSQSGGIYKLI